MASNALQKQQEQRQQEQKQQEQCVLDSLATLSYRSGELDSYLNEIACGVSRLLGSDWSIVTVCQGSAGAVVASSLGLDHKSTEFFLHGTLAGEVIRTGQPLMIEDMRLTAISNQPPGYLAYLGIPLKTIQGGTIGTICSLFHQPHQFTDETIRFVKIFAERAATAIDNYQLYQQQEQHMAELQRVNQQLQTQIREREQAEVALRDRESRLRILVENTADGILLIEPTTGRIVDANRRACENLGYTYEELLQLSPAEIDVKFTPDEILGMQRQLQVGIPLMLESVHRRKDGTTFPIEASICLFECGDRLLGLASVRDISDRKQAEQATARLAEIGELAAMIVHEVRNPLTTVLMGLTTFRTLDLPDSAQERLSLALEEAERLKRLLDEILLYAKHDILQRSELEVNQLISEMLKSCRISEAAGRRIELISTLPTATILGDRDKLIQVFINLIRNACEAIEAGEIVTWRIDLDQTSNQVCISIRNGGEPIPPDLLTKLGTPFLTTKSNGNGLGLAIVKRIVEAHDGKLMITSNAKAGTTVQVHFPLLR